MDCEASYSRTKLLSAGVKNSSDPTCVHLSTFSRVTYNFNYIAPLKFTKCFDKSRILGNNTESQLVRPRAIKAKKLIKRMSNMNKKMEVCPGVILWPASQMICGQTAISQKKTYWKYSLKTRAAAWACGLVLGNSANVRHDMTDWSVTAFADQRPLEQHSFHVNERERDVFQ